MSTIYDIAKATNFSVSTVARALRGNGYCSDEKRKIILSAAQELGYMPMQAAKTLKTKRTNKVLFCIPDVVNPFYYRMINGIINTLEKYNYYPMLCYSKRDLNQELLMIKNLTGHYGDGLIIVSLNVTKQLVEEINGCGMPVVLASKFDIECDRPQFDNVFCDTTIGIRIATQHLIDTGHRQIGYLGGSKVTTTGRFRLLGFQEAMTKAGIEIDSRFVLDGDFTEECGYAVGKQLIADGELPHGMVCANDMMAIGFLHACEEAGVRVPNEVSVVGMDNTELGQYFRPRLTSIAMREEDLGRISVELLMERILNGRTGSQTVSLHPELVIRDSAVALIKKDIVRGELG